MSNNSFEWIFRPVTLDVISRPQLLLALRNAGVVHVLRKSGHCDHIADADGQVCAFSCCPDIFELRHSVIYQRSLAMSSSSSIATSYVSTENYRDDPCVFGFFYFEISGDRALQEEISGLISSPATAAFVKHIAPLDSKYASSMRFYLQQLVNFGMQHQASPVANGFRRRN
jgi:hypothetical protein